MKKKSNPDQDLATAFSALEPWVVADQRVDAHGVLCGLLCAGAADALALWRQYLMLSDEAANPTVCLLGELVSQQLAGEDFNFIIPLPDDETPLTIRVQSLIDWASAFISGLALGGVKSADALLAESKEAYEDIVQMTTIALPNDEQSDELAAEADLTECVEYLRVVAPLIYLELHARANGGRKPASSREYQ